MNTGICSLTDSYNYTCTYKGTNMSHDNIDRTNTLKNNVSLKHATCAFRAPPFTLTDHIVVHSTHCAAHSNNIT